MKNSELNSMSIQELRELNHRIVEILKLKIRLEGQINSDNLSVGMTVKYKGSSEKIKNQTFVIMKINKVNAECKSIQTNSIWNIKLANIEPMVQEERQPLSNFLGESESLRFCKKASDGRGFWIENYSPMQKDFFVSLGFKEKNNYLSFTSSKKDIFNLWTIEEEKKIHEAIKKEFGFTKINVITLSYADLV